MPKFVAAFYQKKEGDTIRPPKRIVRSAINHVKKAIREYPNTEWLVAFYNCKFDVPTVCSLIENLTDVEAEDAVTITVTAVGKCRTS